MNKQKGQAIGTLLLVALLAVQLFFFTPSSPKKKAQKVEKSAAATEKKREQPTSLLSAAYQSSSNLYTLENEDLLIEIDLQGGQIAHAQLKKYTNTAGKPLTILPKNATQMHTLLATPDGAYIDTNRLQFTPVLQSNAEGSQLTLSAQLLPNSDLWVKQIFFLPKEGYQLSYEMQKSPEIKDPVRSDQLLWTQQLHHQEPHYEQSFGKTFLQYYTPKKKLGQLKNGKISADHKKLQQGVQWLSFLMPYFLVGMIAPEGDNIEEVDFTLQKAEKEAGGLEQPLKEAQLRMRHPGRFTLYLGPNDFYTLKALPRKFEKNYALGPRVLNVVNRYVLLPVAQYLEDYIPNYLLILLLLVLLLSLLQLFFAYRNYTMNLKVKGAQPILDLLKPRGKKDPQNAMHLMKIQNEIGAGQLKTLLYSVIQMPIFICMIYFTRNQIGFRQLPFLWIPDVSTYDDLITLPFKLPLLGNHISLLALISVVLFYFSSRFKAPPTVQKDKSTQYLAYLGPVLLLFFFNTAPTSWWLRMIVANILDLLQFALFSLIVDKKSIQAKALQQAQKAYNQLSSTQAQSRTLKRLEKKQQKK